MWNVKLSGRIVEAPVSSRRRPGQFPDQITDYGLSRVISNYNPIADWRCSLEGRRKGACHERAGARSAISVCLCDFADGIKLNAQEK